ncbi:ATP-grasp domain-containing protein [Streptomyces sp. VNUA116]|uniref:ATP-grasp domain-containing protein n=1 Tax=Streptomyces sp. VNUA116 TaxID=3062449 RepID=UPI002676A06C|nr:ATP-grasp domain-containing protein [Streptomyces sp. VNUA116]WKU48843.1 ATP-grasp domain-containing protein [Streptomyces sp. VNUA116]
MRVLIAGLGDNKDFGLKSLRDAGHFVGVIDLPHRVPVNHCDWWRAGDRFSVDSMFEAASSAGFAWDAVLCWEELSTDIAREVAQKLGVPAPRMPAGHFRDKGVMHGRLREQGVPSPQLGVARTAEECERLAGGCFPVVVKPTDYGGSGGVKVVDDPRDLAEAFRAAAALAASGRVAVDRYVVGKEYSVEAVTWAPGETQVLAITDKYLTRPPYCVETGHVSPAAASDEDRELLTAATVRALDALGMEAGVSHAEFRMTGTGPVLMEIAGRPAGGQIPRLVELATGWNLNTAELAAVVGERTVPGAPAAECSAIRFFVGDGRTPFRHPVTWEKASRPPLAGALRELRYFAGEGAVARVPRGPEDRLGYAIFAGTRAETMAALAALDDGAEEYRGD